MSIMTENQDFLTNQIITYIGNKRSLLNEIENQILPIKKRLNKEKLNCLDLFSGSGIVARMLKSHSDLLIVNDLENYSSLVNSCYLSNKNDFLQIQKEYEEIFFQIQNEVQNSKITNGIISSNYAPKNDQNIQLGERVFYTHENAVLIDSYRFYIEKYCGISTKQNELKKYFLAPLITQASIHTNTSGVFKGFYKNPKNGIGCFGGIGKNALPRILGKIELEKPIFSNFESKLEIHQEKAENLVSQLKKIDIAYLDPPYNQHPYGSNYFMLNLIIKNKIEAEISQVSGIVQNWNRSDFNKKNLALITLEKIISEIDAKFLIISYNSEGFITFEEMVDFLNKYGKLQIVEIPYNTFRGSRNLNKREIYVNEYLFILEK